MTVRITWWGHATATIELGGVRVLTDPLLTGRLAHLRRVGTPVPPAAARTADAVLVSHLHLDHLHLPSLRLIGGTGVLVVPHGARRLVDAAGAWRHGRILEVVAGDAHEIGAVRVRAVPAHHDGRRLPLSAHRGPALGYLIEHAGVRVWFAGDTGPHAAIAALAPVDVAVIPVGGWGPTLGPGHLDPGQAAEACAAVGARHAVPVHYGTFWPLGLQHLHPPMFDRSFRQPGRRFAQALAGSGTAAHVLGAGESVAVDG